MVMGITSHISSCKWCGESFIANSTGRPRKYCKTSCRQRAYESRKWGVAEMWEHFKQRSTHCYLCLEPLDWSKRQSLCTDHMIATVHGGRTDVENLRPVHLRCNGKKAATLISEPFAAGS